MATIGVIHADANKYLHNRKRELSILRPFQESGFDVTWAKERVYGGTRISVYFLKPNHALVEAYGFEYEIVLAYSQYRLVESRTLRAVDHVFSSDPAKGRVEPMWFFLASEASDTLEWVSSYLTEHKESRIIVPFSANELAGKNENEWIVRRSLQDHFLSLDRFKYTLPLKEDTYFFGRSKEVGGLVDLCRRSENAGLFGLRKTGKTSVLLKLKRILESDVKHSFELIDAQNSSVRRRRWNQLLEYISRKLFSRESLKLELDFNELDAPDHFFESINIYLKNSKSERLTIAFDEIEWLTPKTARDKHWEDEYLDFWQAIRTTQTQIPGMNIVIAGVNPSIAEESRFGEYQNPLFGIVTPIFLAGMTEAEASEMIKKIGKIMGLNFSEEAMEYLYSQYAGHPLLTRLACSNVGEIAKTNGESFPFKVQKNRLIKDQNLRDTELVFYVRHVVDELERFYPIEYNLLEMLATDDYQGFKDATIGADKAAHLFRYGVVSNPVYPFITYSVLRDYVSIENARREGRPWRVKLIPGTERLNFIRLRLKDISEDLRNLERLIKLNSKPLIFGANSFPEAEKLFTIVPPEDEVGLGSALSVLNKCFVESIENYGQSIHSKKYFWSEIKNEFPCLHEALHRIKVYRHNSHHLELVPGVEVSLRIFLEKDLDDALSSSQEKYWALFQRCLDELFQGIQKETARLESV